VRAENRELLVAQLVQCFGADDGEIVSTCYCSSHSQIKLPVVVLGLSMLGLVSFK
jgi:hypothetical protein